VESKAVKSEGETADSREEDLANPRQVSDFGDEGGE
jgi:hypothetical protein